MPPRDHAHATLVPVDARSVRPRSHWRAMSVGLNVPHRDGARNRMRHVSDDAKGLARRPRTWAALLLLAAVGCASRDALDVAGMSFSAEPLLGKVVWNDLITDDVAATRRFYAELFGWTFESGTGAGRGEYWLAKSGNVYVAGLVPIAPRADGAELARWLPYVSVDDVDGAIARARAAGGEVAAEARNVNLGRVAAILDPEGAVLGLARSNIGDPDDRTTAPASGRVIWTELLAAEPEASSAFYRTVVGYDARTVERRGGEYTFLTSGGVQRAGVFANPSEDAAPRWLTYFAVDDAAAASARAVMLGGTIVLPVSQNLRDGTMAVVTDPSGAILALQEITR